MCCTPNPRAFSWAPFHLLHRCLLAALALVSLSVSTAHAQQVATGVIQGKIQNASNGAYMENVKVAAGTTNRIVTTNAFGEYTLVDVPVGEIALYASYVGEPEQTVNVTVTAGVTTVQDFTFRKTAETVFNKDGSVVLDPVRVNAQRYTNANAIAIAEERNSVNIKNVVAIDSFGDIPSGNVGEFVKFLPGIQVSYGAFGGNGQGYSDNEASGISVRGFGPEDTTVLINGMPVSNATPGNLSRQVGLDQLSTNNASRVEVTKVTTADMPANSMGGQVNLITKSAFEYAKPSYSGRVFFNFNSQNSSLTKTPGPVNKPTYKMTPGMELSVSYPFAKNLGMSLTVAGGNDYSQSYRAVPTYTYSTNFANAAGNLGSFTNPIFSRYKVTDSSMMTTKRSGNLGLDWKPTPSQLLRANFQYSTFDSVEGQRSLDARPTIATGADWDATKTIGTAANSTLDMTVTTRDKTGNTKSGQLTYELKHGGWTVSAGVSRSESTGDYRDRANGHFSEIGLKLNPGKVNLLNLDNGVVRKIETYARTTNGGAPISYSFLNNYGFDGTIAKSGEALSTNTVSLFRVDVERDLGFLKFIGSNTLTIKAGVRRDEDKTEKSGLGTGYSEILRPGASYSITDITDNDYVGQTAGFGLPAQEWASTYKLYALNKANNLFYAPDFDEATNNRVNNYNSYVNQQKSITDTKDAIYGVIAGRFFRNRLSINAGMRQETSKRDGFGPFTDSKWQYAKLANGSLYTDSFYKTGVKYDASNSIRTNADGSTTTITNFLTDTALLSRLTAANVKFPDHIYGVVTNSLESRKLNLIPLRQVHSQVKGKPSFSVSTSFALTKKIDLKAAWSRSFGLPSLEQTTATSPGLVSGSNQFSINENTPIAADGTKGNISVANPNLIPQTSDNLDFEISYYTDTGGVLSVSYYHKKVTNQLMTFATYSGNQQFNDILGALDLDPAQYVDWKVSTATNAITPQITSGFEFQVRQDFGFLGSYGKHFQAFVSLAIKDLADPAVVAPYDLKTPSGSVVPTTPSVATIKKTSDRFGGAGLQFSNRRLSVQLRGTYKNANETGLVTFNPVLPNGNVLRIFEPAETRIDLNVNYTLSKHYSLFLSGRDILNASRALVQKDDLGLLPAYAQTTSYREFGVAWTFGVSGRF